jgi:hypothetical protein
LSSFLNNFLDETGLLPTNCNSYRLWRRKRARPFSHQTRSKPSFCFRPAYNYKASRSRPISTSPEICEAPPVSVSSQRRVHKRNGRTTAGERLFRQRTRARQLPLPPAPAPPPCTSTGARRRLVGSPSHWDTPSRRDRRSRGTYCPWTPAGPTFPSRPESGAL